tara:strand:+ start:322 stop:450 length:129 start_codon:yes stop_codon:yes gene_type:complete
MAIKQISIVPKIKSFEKQYKLTLFSFVKIKPYGVSKTTYINE